MEESLVFLKHLLCWNYSDVASLALNQRKGAVSIEINIFFYLYQWIFQSVMEGSVRTKESRRILRHRLNPDYFIYNHFVQKFKEKLQAFGHDRMADELKLLRRATENFVKKCSLQYVLDRDEVNYRQKMFSEKVNKPIITTKYTKFLIKKLN